MLSFPSFGLLEFNVSDLNRIFGSAEVLFLWTLYWLRAKILWTDKNTRYYRPDSGEGGEILESEFMAASRPYDDDNANLKYPSRDQGTVYPPKRATTLNNTQTTIYVGEYSTLVGARKVYLALARNANPSVKKKIGVLNFASAKNPGGEFIKGSQGQEESLSRASTLYPSLITDVASQFYTQYLEDPGNAYYTHAMVYSPGIVLFRDDNGECRSPVEVDVLTIAAVNAGEIRRELERKERLREERAELEYWKWKWKKRGEERRKENEKAMAERRREEAKNKEEKEEIAILKEEISKLKNLVKEMAERKETDIGKAKESGSENTIDIPDSGLGCGSDLKGAEENTEFSPPTQPSQALALDPELTYAFALKYAEIQIEQTMYARISRLLHLFQLHQTSHLILGSFGTGVSENRIDLVAAIFADLLIKPGGRFKDVFQTVVFAILEKESVRVYSEVFSRVDKRAQRERTSKTRVFVDSFDSRSDGDVKEGDEEKKMRTMRWNVRRSKLGRRNSFMHIRRAGLFEISKISTPQKKHFFDRVQEWLCNVTPVMHDSSIEQDNLST